ncbi:MAG: hypothetical protein L0271_15950 [Gemmatimonadetes bacterium]|nr:hypothetical protein [Gemmatimonadota bacterium]
MTTFDLPRLLALIPAVYRAKDAELDIYDLARIRELEANGQLTPDILRQRGGPLEAFLGVLAAEIAVVEENITQLYDDQFIETCADWVVPYIGDLVGLRTLPVAGAASSVATSRAEVANAIAYRRRKGTAAILEQIARDVTGWPAKLTEYFQRLAVTQHLTNLRPHIVVPDLRVMDVLERIGAPFDRTARTLEVRRIGSARGRYNIPNVGITLWRLRPYDVESAMPRHTGNVANTRFHVNPLGIDAPLFNPPRVEADPLGFAAETDLPDALVRRALARELDRRREAIVNGDDIVRNFFADTAPFAVSVAGVRVPDDQVLICDLSTWAAAPATRSYRRRSDGIMVPHPIGVAVDPVLGRLVFPSGVDPADARVSYTYAFGGDLGGGPYDRTSSVAEWLDPVRRPVTWQIGVSRDAALLATTNPPHSAVVDSLATAVNEWKLHVLLNPGSFGVIAILDSASYEQALVGADRIEVPAGARLAIVAADWPRFDEVGPGGPHRPLGGLSAEGLRPHIRGDVSAVGTPAPDEVLPDGSTRRRTPGELILDGLLVQGALRILVGDLGRLEVRHCTLVPGAGGLAVHPSVQLDLQNATLDVAIERSITGALDVTDTVPRVEVRDSIIDGPLVAPGSQLDIGTTTVLGDVTGRMLDASDAIFVSPVTIARRQLGCVRYSFVPEGSGTPRHFRCQPDLVVSRLSDPALAPETRRRMTPMFTSLRYGDPGYVQLARRCAVEIRTGASDGAAMGAFHWLMEPQREANLRLRLREHLRVGLEAGIFYRT